MKLSVSKTIVDRLSKVKEPCNGKLYGISVENTLYILSLELSTSAQIPVSYSFPAQLTVCGLFQVGNDNVNELDELKDVSTETPVIITRKLESNNITVDIWVDGNRSNCQYDLVEDVNASFIFVNFNGKFAFTCEASVTHIQEQFQKLQTCDSVFFNLKKSNIFLSNDKNVLSDSFNNDSHIGDVYDTCSGQPEEINKKKKLATTVKPKILEGVIFQKVTENGKDKCINKHAPICILDKNPQKVIKTTLQINCIAMMHIKTKVSNIYDVLKQSFIQYLKMYESTLVHRFKANKTDFLLEPFHFYPSQCGHFLTILYPKNETDESLKSYRQNLHRIFLVFDTVPTFRRANRVSVQNNIKPNQPLINPHEGLKPTDNGGQVALVKGQYQYYHYCQDNADDNGWGCAYRSLQTLASWFKMQGYVDKQVPTFYDIQKCLVDIEDKPANFLGSRQWIGSTEVSFVLNTLLGVDCKILFVSSGEEMSTKGPELVEHFMTHGSPIMIGGGVLAHTILGVDYNRETGELRFLILDPHYTGNEDLHTIQSKGWCGWKNVNFWNKTSYYNMCLPLVPREL